MDSEIDEVIQDFILECNEGLDQLDQDLVELETEGGESVLARIFRTVHSIKGASGFLALHKLESVTHVGETLLSRLRDGELRLEPEMVSALLAMADAVREIVQNVEQSRSEGDGDHTELCDWLERLTHGADAGSDDAPAPAPPSAVTEESTDASAPAPAEAELPPSASDETPQKPTDASTEAARAVGATIRVDVGLLDRLMNLVGELVLARNEILQHAQVVEPKDSPRTHSSFGETTQRLNLVTTELQESVMKTRMQPIGTVWSKIPRVVRDLSIACGKSVEIQMTGRETELDKTVLEAIKDPMTHALRNSIDHGIEAPDVREARGKPREGTIRLRAYHDGGYVTVEIEDDGGGIDAEKVRRRAIERGLVSADDAARLGDKEIVSLITSPGFSTAEAVTNVSGRGVGMDVVRTNVERIGGSLDIQSTYGEGTVIRIKIPLTLAIIPALIVESGPSHNRFAIPQVDLLELLRLEGEQIRTQIEFVGDVPVYRLRGDLLPLVDLDSILRVRSADQGSPFEARSDEAVVSIVVVQTGEHRFGLVVGNILDTEEIVVKPLGKQLKDSPIFAGAAIMGDGRVALILDVNGVANEAGVSTDTAEVAKQAEQERAAADGGVESQSLLLIRLGDDGRAAIVLDSIARLEEIPADRLEWSAGQEVIQYRGEILPLIRLSSVFGLPEEDESATDSMQVVVIRRGDRGVGLVVPEVYDIVDEKLTARAETSVHGIRGSVTVQGYVTDLLDVDAIVESALPHLRGEPALAAV